MRSDFYVWLASFDKAKNRGLFGFCILQQFGKLRRQVFHLPVWQVKRIRILGRYRRMFIGIFTQFAKNGKLVVLGSLDADVING